MAETLTVQNRTERNQGIDLLRNLSMFMVVIVHVLNAGGILGATQGQLVKTVILRALYAAVICSVNCYGLISGYVGYRSKWRTSNILTLWLQVFLYSVGEGVLLYICMPGKVAFKELMKLCLPVLTQRYWYFTAYVALFFTMPLLNAALDKLSRKQFEISFGILLFLLTVCQQTFLVNNSFGTNNGYSYLWLIVLYCVGGYLKKYEIKPKNLVIPFVGYVACIGICLVARVVMRHLGFNAQGRLEAYNSPVVFLMGVMLMLLFSNMEVPAWLGKVVSFLAPASFGVYLIHTHPIVLDKILRDAFVKIAECPAWSLMPLIIGIGFAVYILCSVFDLGRHYLFKILNIKTMLSKLDKKIFPDNGSN